MIPTAIAKARLIPAIAVNLVPELCLILVAAGGLAVKNAEAVSKLKIVSVPPEPNRALALPGLARRVTEKCRRGKRHGT